MALCEPNIIKAAVGTSIYPYVYPQTAKQAYLTNLILKRSDCFAMLGASRLEQRLRDILYITELIDLLCLLLYFKVWHVAPYFCTAQPMLVSCTFSQLPADYVDRLVHLSWLILYDAADYAHNKVQR